MNDRPKRSAARWATALLALAAFLWAADWAIGRFLNTPAVGSFDPRFGLVDLPHTRVVQSQEGWSEIRTNAFGLNDEELRVDRPRLRALLMGDSYAEALQVPREQNFASVAERACPGLEVVNAGHAGRFLAHYAAFLPSAWRAVEPDILVLQVNDTDVGELAEPELLANVWRERAGHPRELESAAANPVIEAARVLLRRSALLKFAYVRATLLARYEQKRFARKLAPRPAAGVADNPVWPRAVVEGDSLMAEIVRFAPHPVVLYVPNLDYFASPPGPGSPPRRAFWRALAERYGATFVDPTDTLLAVYRRDGEFLHGFSNTVIGEGHVNARGHAVIGRMLGEALARRMR